MAAFQIESEKQGGQAGSLSFLSLFFFEEENLGHSIQKIFCKFGHSSEFRVFSLENIENLVVNLCPGSVY